MKNLINSIIKLNNFNKSFENNKFKVVTLKNVFNSDFLFLYYFSLFDFESNIKTLLLNYFIKSEKLYPGSSYLLSKEICNKYLNNITLSKEKAILKTTKENVKNYFYQKSKKEYVDLFFKILELSGPNSTLICKENKNKEILVEKYKKSYFEIKIHEDFSNIYFSNVKYKSNDFLFFIVDGFIEKESEINFAIDEAINKKKSCIFISRGISSNVSSFLKNLVIKRKIYFFPYISKFENKDPFLFNDISKSLDIEIIDTKYNSINTGIEENIRIIEKVRIENNKISFSNINKKLLKEINNQIKEAKDEDLKNYLYKRKNRILSEITNIHIPEDKKEFMQEIKNLILCYNELLRFGMLKNENIILSVKEIEITKKLSDNLFEKLNNIGFVIENEK